MIDHGFDFMFAALAEANRAVEMHGDFSSLHEAYAVMLEEMDEFKEEVWKKAKDRDLENVRTELIQIAAMAYKAVHLVDNLILAGMAEQVDAPVSKTGDPNGS